MPTFSTQSMHISVPTGAIADIAPSQAVATNGYVTQNGPLGGNSPYQANNFIAGFYMRNISITDLSGTNLTGINFIITGVQNGIPTGETLAGPTANGIVYSVIYYDYITSIKVASAVTNICVGSGNLSTILYRINTSASRYATPGYTITLNNPDATVNTRIDAITYIPSPLENYDPATDVNGGTTPIKASNANATFNSISLTADALPFPVQGLFVKIADFPVVPVVVNILQG